MGTGISWSGGNSGVGVEIVPPFYPCYVRKLEFYIVDNALPTGFYSLMYDNTGLDNGPGNLLDSTYFDPSLMLYPEAWNTITLPAPIQIDSGSIFIEWRMQAESISLGTDNTLPISNRSYEVLGGWSIFRYRETQDPMIRAIVATTATAGIGSDGSTNFVGEFYPSPADGRIFMDLSLENSNSKTRFDVFNLQGQLVQTAERSVNGNQRVMLDISSLSPGLYVCNIVAGDDQFNRKFIVR